MARDEDPADFDLDDEDADEEGGATDTCPHCGEEIYEGIARCPYCKEYITDEEADVDRAVSLKRARRQFPWWVLVGVGLAIVSTLAMLRWIGN